MTFKRTWMNVWMNSKKTQIKATWNELENVGCKIGFDKDRNSGKSIKLKLWKWKAQ
jgi:hypothetical protein